MDGSTERIFRFYKLFCPETSSQNMEIPISFKESVGGIIPKKVTLRNYYKKVWSIEITETGDGLYFHNGWSNFVKGNSITNGDCLVFYYNGYGLFEFILFDQSGCEKIVMKNEQTRVKKEVKEEDDDTDQEEEEEDDDSDFVIEDDKNEVKGEKDDDEEVKAYVSGFTTSKRNRNSVGGSKKGDDDDDDDDTDQDDDEEDCDFVIEDDKDEVEEDKDDEKVKATYKRNRNSACGSKKGVGASAGEGSSSKKNKYVLDHFGADLFKSGKYTQLKNPYFVTKLGRKERHTLYIPMDVIKEYNIELPPSLMLRDPRGKEWKANVHIWGDGRTWLSGKWRNMCKQNLIGKDGMLICEFVSPRRGDMFLQVTIVQGQAAN